MNNDLISKAHKKWRAEISELDEFFGRKPRAPLAAHQEHLTYEMHKQNEILKKLSATEQSELKNTTNAICGSIENGFSELYEINQNGFEAITNSIDANTTEISKKLGEVNRNLEKIDATLHWGFSALINQLTITNKKLDQIIHLLNIPDSQRQRKYHIEQGFDFLKKSNTNSLFFNKSKQHFEEVIKIEDADYLSLQQLGIIHLYSKELLDFQLSEKYFEQSILYSNSDIGFTRNQQNSSSFHFTYNPSKITATSLMHLARNYFIRDNYKKAFETAKRAVNIYEMVGVYFDLSKYACALNDDKGTLLFLTKAISMDRYISVKTLNEELLITQNYVQDFLKSLENKTTSKAFIDLKDLKAIANQNSIYKNELIQIESLVKKNTYLDSLLALEKIGYELEN